ncbi:hypothetical protein [Deinococcus ruber]|uniref:Uncharacterized protein n=1 Tax=Deinococcus ruber TaxID=1848197 RepID=A0A918C894_9DEIO|nr:hypothetical protein [Deinococcus ruber]GGR11590.1 hypothetical protein GCM10008957_25710 [Deinococcus ruber]
MTRSQPGTGRFTLGLVLILGAAGQADQSPLTLRMLPLAALALLIAAWGLSRMENHAGLRRFLRQRRASLLRTRQQRHQHIYMRAARR